MYFDDRAPARGVQLDRIDAARLGKFQGLEDLGLGVVGREQLRGVHQVAAVGPAADQVAADEQPAERHVADLAARQAAGRNVGLGLLRRSSV